MSQGAEYTTYEFTNSVGIDYNYDPSGRSTPGNEPAFDPYTDALNSPPKPSAAVLPKSWSHSFTREDVERDNHVSRAVDVDANIVEPPRRPPTPIPTEPSPEYLLESQKQSVHLSAPTEARKLLILDLNGTLVHRTPHARRENRVPRRRPHPRVNQFQNQNQSQYIYAEDHQLHYQHQLLPPYSYQPPSQRHTSPDPGDPYADPTAPRGLRNAYPRPYMRSFQQYLFHPDTRSWLDTMVWSSAQPHSVADMVDKCFGASQEDLVAIWARDTLGLEEKDYHRKTQTTKDLARPWAKLSIPPSTTSSTETPQVHSAHTTLLLDDSPLKAHLQPYNHLCIREYSGALRQSDLQCRAREQREQQLAQGAGEGEGPIETEAEIAEPPVHTSPSFNPSSPSPTLNTASPSSLSQSPSIPYLDPTLSSSPAHATTKKRKRPKNKKKAAPNPDGADAEEALGLGLGGYDPTLLAVVGVLEAVKWEGNVAGWMRAGGLAPRLRSSGSELDSVGVDGGMIRVEAAEDQSAGELLRARARARALADVDSTSVDSIASAPGDGKRRRVSGEQEQEEGQNGKDQDLEEQDKKEDLKNGSRETLPNASPDPGTSTKPDEGLISAEGVRDLEGGANEGGEGITEEGNATGTADPVVVVAPTPTPAPAAPAPAPAPAPKTQQTQAPNLGDTGQWFEDPLALRYWVRMGVRALQGMGIEVVSGVTGQ